MREPLGHATDLRRSKPQRSAFFWVTLALSAFYLFLFAFATYEISIHYGVRKASGWAARPSADGWFMTTVENGTAAADLIHVGDRLLAIDGTSVRDGWALSGSCRRRITCLVPPRRSQRSTQ